jgi:hypothetical protein
MLQVCCQVNVSNNIHGSEIDEVLSSSSNADGIANYTSSEFCCLVIGSVCVLVALYFSE